MPSMSRFYSCIGHEGQVKCPEQSERYVNLEYDWKSVGLENGASKLIRG